MAKFILRDPERVRGTNAQELYYQYCDEFGWKESMAGLFGQQQILYAKGATPEGYSPWFLPHNCWTKTTNGNWYNEIKEDRIEEIWKDDTVNYLSIYRDLTTRVTFAKRKVDGKTGYVFLGLFVPREEIREEVLTRDMYIDGKLFKRKGETVYIKTYDLVSKTYPAE